MLAAGFFMMFAVASLSLKYTSPDDCAIILTHPSF